MGLYEKSPHRIILNLPVEYQTTFAKFNTLSVVNRKRKEKAFYELIEKELNLPENAETLATRWIAWDNFVYEMLQAGFSINRTMIWKYQKKGYFTDLIRTDGVSTLYDVQGFIKFYRGEKE